MNNERFNQQIAYRITNLGSIFFLAISQTGSDAAIVFSLAGRNNVIIEHSIYEFFELAMCSSIIAAVDCLIWAVLFIDILVSILNSLIVNIQLSPFIIELVLDISLSIPLLWCDIWSAIFKFFPNNIGISLPCFELSILSLCLEKQSSEWSSLSSK